MKVLFGSIEYFENEFLNFAKNKNEMNSGREYILEIYTEIKEEIINDFICEENIKKEVLKNLNLASERFLCRYEVLS